MQQDIILVVLMQHDIILVVLMQHYIIFSCANATRYYFLVVLMQQHDMFNMNIKITKISPQN